MELRFAKWEVSSRISFGMMGRKGTDVAPDTERQAGREQESGTGEHQCDGGARWRRTEVRKQIGGIQIMWCRNSA